MPPATRRNRGQATARATPVRNSVKKSSGRAAKSASKKVESAPNNSDNEKKRGKKKKKESKWADLRPTFPVQCHLDNPKYDNAKQVFKHVAPDVLTENYYEESGLAEPLLFKTMPVGMKMISKDVVKDSFQPVVGMFGGKNSQVFAYMWKEMDGLGVVVEITIEQLIKYIDGTEKHKEGYIYFNSISNEMSIAPIGPEICPPQLLQDIDFASWFPDARKQRSLHFFEDGSKKNYPFHPSIGKFLLVTSPGVLTDFHIDLGGTTVWYHILKGSKVFFVIEPTEENLAAYEEWYKIPTENKPFLGEMVTKCTRILLTEGTTMILPAGWLHAVYTPEKSLVFGGNFPHIRGATTQIRVEKVEKMTGEGYEFLEETLLYIMADIVKEVTGRTYIRPTSRKGKLTREQADKYLYVNIQYCGKRFMELGRNKVDYKERDFAEGGRATVIDEDQDYVEYAEMEEAMLDRHRKKKLNANDLMADKIFYHPEFLRVNESEGRKSWAFLAQQLGEEPQLTIDNDKLRARIKSKEVPEWKALIANIKEKKTIALPKGLTRPASLVACLEALIARRVELEKVAPAVKPSTVKKNVSSSAVRKGVEKDDNEPQSKKIRQRRATTKK